MRSHAVSTRVIGSRRFLVLLPSAMSVPVEVELTPQESMVQRRAA
jgi:hypothetical protein